MYLTDAPEFENQLKHEKSREPIERWTWELNIEIENKKNNNGSTVVLV